MTSRSLMTAMSLMRPSQRGHASTPTRCISVAPSMRPGVLRGLEAISVAQAARQATQRRAEQGPRAQRGNPQRP